MHTIDQAKNAAKRLHARLAGQGDETVKLSAAQTMVAHAFGLKDWHALQEALRLGAIVPPDRNSMIDALAADIGASPGGRDGGERAIGAYHALIESSTGAKDGSEALAVAAESHILVSADRGLRPGLGGRLDTRKTRAGAKKIDGRIVEAQVVRNDDEGTGLRVIDAAYVLREPATREVVAVLVASGYMPRWDLSDHEAVMSADVESDMDASTVSGIVEATPDIFEEADGVVHVRSLEVRTDLRRRGIAKALVGAAIADLGKRYDVHVAALSHDPDDLLDHMPAMHSRGHVRDEVRALAGAMMSTIALAHGIDSISIQDDEVTPDQALVRLGHLLEGGSPGDAPRHTAREADLMATDPELQISLGALEGVAAEPGVLSKKLYPQGRETFLHKAPNTIIDLSPALFDLLPKGVASVEVVTAPRRLDIPSNYVDMSGTWRVTMDDGRVHEIANEDLDQNVGSAAYGGLGALMAKGMDERTASEHVTISANLRTVHRYMRPEEHEGIHPIVHSRTLTRRGVTTDDRTPPVDLQRVITALGVKINPKVLARRYDDLVGKVFKEGMLADQDNVLASMNRGRTIAWSEVRELDGQPFDIRHATLADLCSIPLSPTIETIHDMPFDRHEQMMNRIITVTMGYLSEVLDDTLAQRGAELGVTREQLALNGRFVEMWRKLVATAMSPNMARPLSIPSVVR